MKTQDPIELRRGGLSYAQIGKKLGISAQRAQQLIAPPKAVVLDVINRANWTCKDCGAPTSSGHVHHISEQVADRNDPSNLEYLCVTCHTNRHTVTRPMPKNKIVSFKVTRKDRLALNEAAKRERRTVPSFVYLAVMERIERKAIEVREGTFTL